MKYSSYISPVFTLNSILYSKKWNRKGATRVISLLAQHTFNKKYNHIILAEKRVKKNV